MASRIRARTLPRLYIREWRERLEWSQEKAGSRMPGRSVSGVTWGRWENYDKKEGRRPDLGTLAAIAEALGRRSEDMYRHPDQPSADELLRDKPPELISQALRLIKALTG